MYPIGLSSCGKALNQQLFADYAKAGISAIEITPPWHEYKFLDYKALASYAKNTGITLWSFHLPFETTDLSSPEMGWRVCCVEYLSELIKHGSDIGIHKFIAHPSTEIPLDSPDRAERMKYAKESLNQLADIAARYDSVICVEDLPRGCLGNCSEEILDLISANDKLRVCFDTNHLLNEDIPTFVRRVGSKIVSLHVSDYDFVDERHWLPGEGQIQWSALLDALKEVGYNGVWMYELGFKAKEFPRILTCEDFVQNAKKLFAGETL